MSRGRNTGVEVTLSVDGEAATLPLSAMTAPQLLAGSPVRVFRWHRGQRHFPGWYWSATDRRHVIYESRLELARLVLADFDPTVAAIRSQPMWLSYRATDGRRRRHVPDFALFHTDGRIRVVNVKPADRLAVEAVSGALEEVNEVLAGHGYETEIWSGDHPVVLQNVTYLAGYRNPQLFIPDQLDRVHGAVTRGMALADVETAMRRQGVGNPRPLLMHLLWTHRLHADLSQPLQPTSTLEAA